MNIKNNLRTETFLIFLGVTFFLLLVSYATNPVNGGVGNNTTVVTYLDVGNVYPEVLNVTIENFSASITLIPNQTKLITCVALLRDFNNDTDIQNVYSEFFNSTWGGANDNNVHYTNASCFINRSFVNWNGVLDDNYTALSTCSYNIWYYATAGSWNCTVFVNDSINWNGTGSDDILINELLALNLPDSINYGTVNATYVSLEQFANVSNAGNVRINLSLDGYAVRRYDNLSMNCTLGSIKNISIMHEKFNLTQINPGIMTRTVADGLYTNLSSNPTIMYFGLKSRQDDNIDDAINTTYWRMYVPLGVAGTCSGNIVVGASVASGV